MKRIISLFLTLLLLLNVVAVSVSATEIDATESTAVETETSVEIIDETMLDTEIVDETEESSDNVVEVELATESYEYDKKEAPAQTGASNVLNFDATTAGWKNYKKVFCHIWVYGGDPFYAWQSKLSSCSDSNGDGIWTYDLDAKHVILESGVLYGVIFSNENGMQTYSLLFDSSVLGDTAYCDSKVYENPVDSSKTAKATYWRNQDAKKFGPELCITHTGKVVGTCVPYTTSAQAIFENFLINNLENARVYSGKSDQKLLDDIGTALGFTVDNVTAAIKSTGVKVLWYESSSFLPGFDDPTEPSSYSPPIIQSITATSDGIKLTWKKPEARAESYYIYRKTSTSSWKKIKTITNYKTTSYTDNTVKSSGTYYYAMKSTFKHQGVSWLSDSVKITYIAKPTISSITSTSSGLKVSWKKVSNVTGYEVYRKASNEDSYKKVATIKGAVNTSYHDKSVKNGITYRYALKAYKSKTKSPYSYTKQFDPKAKSEIRLAKKGTRTLSLSAIKSKKYYYSSNKKVFTVNSKGKITAKAGGKATLTVKAKGVCVKTTILVSSPKVTLSASKTKIYRGYSTTIKSVSYPDNVKISWKTSNSKVATVNSSGKVTGKGRGTATITASIKYNGKTYKKSIKISVVCQKPSIRTDMSQKPDFDDTLLLFIKNTGTKTMRIYSEGATYCGVAMKIVTFKDGYIPCDEPYRDIKPGETTIITFATVCGENIYQKNTFELSFKLKYDSLYYRASTCAILSNLY